MQAQCHSVLIRTYLIFMNIEKVNLDTLRGDVKTPKHDLYIYIMQMCTINDVFGI